MSKELVVEKNVACFHERMTEEGLTFSIYMCSECDEDLDEALTKWVSLEEAVGIHWRFKVPEILDSMIEWNERPAGPIDINAKPMFDAFRTQLQAMCDRMDALRFE